jgi:hypothetical protein
VGTALYRLESAIETTKNTTQDWVNEKSNVVDMRDHITRKEKMYTINGLHRNACFSFYCELTKPDEIQQECLLVTTDIFQIAEQKHVRLV